MDEYREFLPNDPFAKLTGDDGFHIVKTQHGKLHMLSCIVYAGGKLYNVLSTNPDDATVEIIKIRNPNPAQVGAMERLRLVLESVCRYLTTGGQWGELDEALRLTRTVAKGGWLFPGYHLSTTYSISDGTYQHVFVKDGTTDAVLWQESELSEQGFPMYGWIESTTLDAIREQQENDEGIWRGRVETEAYSPQQIYSSDILSLPPASGVRPPESPEGGSGV